MWPEDHILDLFGIEVPIIQASMAGSALSDMVVAINANFFCHQPRDDTAREMSWRRRLCGHFVELGLDPNGHFPNTNRASPGEKMCDLVMEFHPEVVSFHFGLPEKSLLLRVRKAGAKILSAATSVDEARWLEDQGCDAIVAGVLRPVGMVLVQAFSE